MHDIKLLVCAEVHARVAASLTWLRFRKGCLFGNCLLLFEYSILPLLVSSLLVESVCTVTFTIIDTALPVLLVRLLIPGLLDLC